MLCISLDIFCWEKKKIFYEPHGSNVQVFRRIVIWLLLFLECKFIVVYKPNRTHVVVDVLSRLLDSSKPLGVLNQTMDASLFSIEPIWMQEVRSYLKASQMPKTLNLI